MPKQLSHDEAIMQLARHIDALAREAVEYGASGDPDHKRAMLVAAHKIMRRVYGNDAFAHDNLTQMLNDH